MRLRRMGGHHHQTGVDFTVLLLDKEDTNKEVTKNHNILTKAGEEVGIDRQW